MEVQTRLSVASTTTVPVPVPVTAPGPNHAAEVHVEETMAVDFPEQLLTPENSRSETSSNHEQATTEDRSTPLRRSTRATRGSLRSAKQTDSPATTLQSTTSSRRAVDAASGLALINGIAKRESRPSSLRDGIAALGSSGLSKTTLASQKGGPDHYDRPMALDTPISEASQEPHPENASTPLQPHTLRKLMENVLTGKENNDPEEKSTPNADRRRSLRRSTRVSLTQQTPDLLNKSSSILGKRSRDGPRTRGEAAKENERRVSLRPRKPVVSNEDSTPPSSKESPATKRPRNSTDSPPGKPTENGETEAARKETPVRPPAPQNRRKKWLSHGLYSGQEHTTETRAYQNRKGSKRRSSTAVQRRYLPMPMFAGDRLLKTGRDFQLPFDVFSPLPPGQPKPDEWRKTNKSMRYPDVDEFIYTGTSANAN